jgi:2-polyprenyl-3-methyl-5-hydroxy-6-metoxy-1,4-benzoquinol methylase
MTSPQPDFVSAYVSLRQREGWLYSDEEVRMLPHTTAGMHHKKEWAVRARSARRFRQFVAAKTPLRLLEVGCGNGWLSHYLAQVPGIHVTGIDINRPELVQAARVFKKPNLEFIETRLEELHTPPFDIVLFAASFQYFSNVREVLDAAFGQLKPSSAIHIIDTHFYPDGERASARARSAAYFDAQEAGAMSSYYFHHCLSDMAPYKYRVRNQLSWRLRRVTGTVFPWIEIKSPA